MRRREINDGSTSTLAALLAQLSDVVALLPMHCYRAQPASRVSGSVGTHVRHTLDHVSALLAAIDGDELDYEHRKRGTGVETDPFTAVVAIEQMIDQLSRVDDAALERRITFATMLDVASPATRVRTTLSREVAFVVQHTIHHCALIAVLLDTQGVVVPHGFGVAPATQRARLAG